MISFDRSGDLEMFYKTAHDLARARLRPAARQAERDGAPPEGLNAEVAELGFNAIELPESVGGLAQGLMTRAVVEEALAFGDLGLTLALPGPGPFGAAVLALGDEAQHTKFLAPMIDAGGKGTIAWSEEKPRPKTFSAVAVEDADGRFTINGRKTDLVAGHTVSAVVVFARVEGRGPCAFVVDAGAEGVRFSEPHSGLGLQAAPVVTMTLEGVVVDASHRLCGADDRFAGGVVEMFSRIAVVAAARSVGLSQAAFEYARDFAADREAFGKPIAHFQGLAFLIADMATRVEVMRAMVSRAAWSIDRGERDMTTRAAMAAAECHEGAMFVTDSAVQVLGGAGYVQDHPVEKWMRDAKAHMAYGLPRQLCDLFVGKRALEGAAMDLEDDAPMPGLASVMV